MGNNLPYNKNALEGVVDSSYLRHYIYIYAYPDGRVFYVGKGKGNRILDHEAEARRGVKSPKCDIIRSIWSKKEEVLKIKLAFFDNENDALRYEASLIASLDGLSNILQGRRRISEIFLSQEDLRYFGQSIRKVREDGTEYWSAREVADFLGYSTWVGFQRVIRQAMKNCQQAGESIEEHFKEAFKIKQIGNKTVRSIGDYHLTRHAFLIAIMSANPENYMVMIGKGYMARRALGGNIKGLGSQERCEEQKYIERQQQPSLFDESEE